MFNNKKLRIIYFNTSYYLTNAYTECINGCEKHTYIRIYK